VYLVVITPVLGFYDQREAALEQRRMLEPRLRATAATVPVLQSQLAKYREAASTRKVVIEGASDAIASANLQSRIEELAASSGVSISSTEGLPAEARGVHRRIGLRIAISGPYEGIVHLLAAIETATPPLIVDNVQIHGTMQMRPQQPRSALLSQQRGLPPGDVSNIPRLDAGCEVYGFRSNDSPAVVKQ
jgi:general secretion pathway protein M